MPNVTRNKTTGTATASDTAVAASGSRKRSEQGKKAKAGKPGKTTRRHAGKEQAQKLKAKEKKAKRGAQGDKAETKSPRERISSFILEAPLVLKVLGAVIVFLLIAFVMLYPMGCTYYQALREEQRYQAELDAVNARNDAIQQENDALETDEGVENQARKELGWVKDGEQAVIISNSDGELSSGMPDQVEEGSIEAPHTWYYDILDFVFQAKTRQS